MDATPIGMLLRERIADVPNFPRPGIVFKDITPILFDPAAFRGAVDAIVARWEDHGVDVILGIESRGFIFGAAIAYRLGLSLVPVRKPGKLPRATVREEYELEYGSDALEMHYDAITDGARVLVVDDLLATGGTAAATARLVESKGGVLVGFAFVVELGFLSGRKRLGDHKIQSLVTYT